MAKEGHIVGNIPDRRIQKTQAALHEALISLMRERPYELIMVKNILDRANVGRSTFYMHYKDKDELLIEGLQHLQKHLQQAQADAKRVSKNNCDRVIGFSLAMFEHAYEHQDVYRTLVGGQAWIVIGGHMQEMIVQIIHKEAKPIFNNGGASDIPFELFTHTIGSSFWVILTWWLNQKKTLPPAQINTIFRDLITPVLATKLV
jgi:AcrR family transcriptional regulator